MYTGCHAKTEIATEEAERKLMDLLLLHLPPIVTFRPAAYSPACRPSPLNSVRHSVHMNVGSDSFGLVDTRQRQLEGNTTVGREGES